MNKTLIAAAVSAALLAPVAAQAEEDEKSVTLYGRVHQGIHINNPEVGDSTTNFIGVSSRFGIKASSELGNGMTASAQYEFATSSDAPGSGVVKTRVATVGLSGAFGSVNLGNQWGAYYNQVGVHVDPTFWVGGAKYYLSDGPLRTPNTIKYSNSFGPVSLEVDARLDDSGAQGGDGHAAAVSIAVNDNITLAAGVDNTKDGNSITGAAIQVSLGNYWASIAQHSVNPEGDGADPSTTQIWVGGSFGDTAAMLGRGQGNKDAGNEMAGDDPSDVTLGVYHNLGGGFKLLYEGHRVDSDGAGGDKTEHLLGIRLDF